MQKSRGSRILNQPGRKRLGVKRSQVQVLSPRLVDSPQESGPIGFADVRQCSGMNPKTGKRKRGNPVSPILSPGRQRRRAPARRAVNRVLKRIRGLFKWAASIEIVPPSSWNGLLTVEPLRKGRITAPELPPVRAVPDEIMEATLPHLPPLVAGGLDAAQVRLGHKNASITQVYAEVSREKAAELALKLG